MKNKKGLLLLFSIMLIPFSVKAENFSVSINCSSSVKAGERAKCIINFEPNDNLLTSVRANYSIPSDVVFDSFEPAPGLNYINNASGFSLEGNFSAAMSLGTLNVVLPSDALSNSEYKISLIGISGHDESNNYNANETSSNIRVKSNENRLSSLSISGGSIDFDSETLNYITTIDNDSAVISAASIDSNAKVSGNIGSVSLNYGTNTFKINVTSETGEIRTYTINVTRPDNRSNNNNLSTLIITDTNILFDKDKTKYDLTTTASEIQISASKEDSKSSMVGSIGKHILNYGLNTFSIKVIAENGSVKTYNINITRQDVRSDNNYLKSLTLSKGILKFSKIITTYNVDVENDVEKITVSAILDDSKSSFVDGYGPKEFKLELGNNTIYIKVESEKGEVRTYTLNINRKDGRNSDSTLKEIKLSDGKIEFKPNILEYKVNVEYNIENFKIEATPNSDKSIVVITGDDKLEVGENVFKITVEAENGKKSEYKVIVIRKKEGEKLSSNNYIKSITIKNHSLDFSKSVYRYTIKTKENKLNLSIVLDDKKSEYEVTGNKNLKDGSKIIIKVKAENGDIRNYIIDIHKTSNILIIMIIILLTIITFGLIVIILLNRKKKLSKKLEKLVIESQNKLDDNKIEEKNENDDIAFTDEDFTEFQ